MLKGRKHAEDVDGAGFRSMTFAALVTVGTCELLNDEISCTLHDFSTL